MIIIVNDNKMMSILVQEVSMQQLNHAFNSFLQHLHKRLLVIQPELYIVSNNSKCAVNLQVTWKSKNSNQYVTYNNTTTYKSDYYSAIGQMKKVCEYALKDAESLANSPFIELFFGMQPTAQEIENSALENPIYKC